MADHLREPANAQTKNATKQSLGKGPEDMPDRGGRQGETHTDNATKVPLSRTEHHVAQFGMRAGMGEVQNKNASECDLSRKANSPYDRISRTKPQEDLKK